MLKYLSVMIWVFLSTLFIFSFNHDILVLRLNLWLQITCTAFIIASSGAMLQSILRNPLADPWMLGISGLANLASVTVGFMSLNPAVLWRNLASFGGAIGSLGILRTLTKRSAVFDANQFILIGIALNALSSSLIVFLQAMMSPNDFFLSWVRLSGYFVARSSWEIIILTIAKVTMLLFLIKRRQELLILQTGEELSYSVGVDSAKIKKEALLIMALCLAIVISISGSIAFLGLVTPHIIRKIWSDQEALNPLLIFSVSNILLLSAGIFLRLLPLGVYVPIGIMMTIIGAPFFIQILLQKNKLAN